MAAISERARTPQSEWLRLVFTLVRREVRDSLRDWRIVAPITILTLFFPVPMKIESWLETVSTHHCLTVSRYVPAFLRTSTISSGAITPGSNTTVLISRDPFHPLVTFSTPFSPSRADLPTLYQPTANTMVENSARVLSAAIEPETDRTTTIDRNNTMFFMIDSPLTKSFEWYS